MDSVSETPITTAPFSTRADKLLLLVATLVYAGGVSVYIAISTTNLVRKSGGAQIVGDTFNLLFAGLTFYWLVLSALGFVLMAGVLDVLSERRPQPLSALSFALAAFATFELLKPLLLGLEVHLLAMFMEWPSMS